MAYTYVVYSCDTHPWHVDTPWYPEYDDDNTVMRDGIVPADSAYRSLRNDVDGKFRTADRNEHYGDVPDGIVLNVQAPNVTDIPDAAYDDLPF